VSVDVTKEQSRKAKRYAAWISEVVGAPRKGTGKHNKGQLCATKAFVVNAHSALGSVGAVMDDIKERGLFNIYRFGTPGRKKTTAVDRWYPADRSGNKTIKENGGDPKTMSGVSAKSAQIKADPHGKTTDMPGPVGFNARHMENGGAKTGLLGVSGFNARVKEAGGVVPTDEPRMACNALIKAEGGDAATMHGAAGFAAQKMQERLQLQACMLSLLLSATTVERKGGDDPVPSSKRVPRPTCFVPLLDEDILRMIYDILNCKTDEEKAAAAAREEAKEAKRQIREAHRVASFNAKNQLIMTQFGPTTNARILRHRLASSKVLYRMAYRVYRVMKYTIWDEIDYFCHLDLLDAGLASRLQKGFRAAGRACSSTFSMMNSAGKTPKGALEKHGVTLGELEKVICIAAKLPVQDGFSNATFSAYGV
jgi:hypothetical protein